MSRTKKPALAAVRVRRSRNAFWSSCQRRRAGSGTVVPDDAPAPIDFSASGAPGDPGNRVLRGAGSLFEPSQLPFVDAFAIEQRADPPYGADVAVAQGDAYEVDRPDSPGAKVGANPVVRTRQAAQSGP